MMLNLMLMAAETHGRKERLPLKSLPSQTTQSANCYLDSNGQLQKVSSSRKYKMDITEVTEAEALKMLSVQPVTYTGKNDGKSAFGYIAEQVEEQEPRLVVHGEDGLPNPYSMADLTLRC